jgi:hypothetical protein
MTTKLYEAFARELAVKDPGAMVLERIGCGVCGDVWDAKSTASGRPSRFIIKSEKPYSYMSLENEFGIYLHLMRAFEAYPQMARNINIPTVCTFLTPAWEHWETLLPRFAKKISPREALVVEKIRPIPYKTRKFVTDIIDDDGFDEDIPLEDEEEAHCLIRPYLGKACKMNNSRLDGLPCDFILRFDMMERAGIDAEV